MTPRQGGHVARLPKKLITAALVGSVVVFYFLPRRAEYVGDFLTESRSARLEKSVKQLVVDRIKNEICPVTELCAYEPLQWNEISPVDSSSFTVVHTFRMNQEERRYLFRTSSQSIDEIHRIR